MNVRSSVRFWALATAILAGSVVDAKHSTFCVALDRSLVLAIFTSRQKTRRVFTGYTIALAIVAFINAFTSVKADMLVVRTHFDDMLAKIPSKAGRTDTVFVSVGCAVDQVVDVSNMGQNSIILAPLGTYSIILTL